MATASRDESPPVEQPGLDRLLEDDPHAVDFFQAVRLLHRLLRDRSSVGGFGNPKDEVVRFSVPVGFGFPPSAIESLTRGDDGPARMVVSFMGLTGPLGVLPYAYSQLVSDRVRNRDPALKAFLDLFHHRIISLFYRAWLKNRFDVAFEDGEADRVTEHMLDVVGLGTEQVRNRLPVRDETFLFYAGLLGPQQRSAAALEQMLEDYFGVRVEVEQFVGGWYRLGDATQCRLGDEDGASGQLGLGAVAGDEVWDQQARVRVRLGPLTRAEYDEFLPTGSSYQPLKTLTRFFSGDQYDFEIQLVLARSEVPAMQLGATNGDRTPLGWCTWLRTAPLARDPDETILTY